MPTTQQKPMPAKPIAFRVNTLFINSIIWRYIAIEYTKAFFSVLGGLAAIWLVIDYVDQSKNYTGVGWWKWVLELYFNKAISACHELAPGSLLLAAGITMAGLKKNGEHTALRALAVSPFQLFAPVAFIGLVVVGGLVITDDLLVGQARKRVDEINAKVFHKYGSWKRYYGETRWFAGKKHIYHLRESGEDQSFKNVTIFSISKDFRLFQRIDAKKMEPLGGRRWRLREGAQRNFIEKKSPEVRFSQREFEFEETPSSFNILKGRPEQMRIYEIIRQMEIRKNIGLTSERFLFALHNKFSYPLAGLPGALLACVLALRPGRRNYLVSAFVEGFAVIIFLWALMVVCKAASLSDITPAHLAAWAPVGMLTIVSAIGTWKLCR